MINDDEITQCLSEITELQKKFQKLCGKHIETEDNFTKSLLSEMYLFKAIEEIVELRKTFPSALNDSAKIQPKIDRNELLKEFCDVALFLLNFSILWKISLNEFIESLKLVQSNNFKKKIDSINEIKDEFLNYQSGGKSENEK